MSADNTDHRLARNHFIQLYMMFLAGKSPNIRSYTVYTPPYIYTDIRFWPTLFSCVQTYKERKVTSGIHTHKQHKQHKCHRTYATRHMQRRVMSGIKGVYATQVVATAAFEKKSGINTLTNDAKTPEERRTITHIMLPHTRHDHSHTSCSLTHAMLDRKSVV